MPDLGLDVLFKGQNFARLMGGLAAALQISLISVLLSIPIGLFLGALMELKNKWISLILRIYLEIVRIMPQMVLLFVVFFGSARVMGWNIDGTTSSIIVFTFWGSAEMMDLTRSALSSIPKSQFESAYALGLSTFQVYWHVILPQAIRQLIPLSVNLITRMIKTSSLVMMVGVIEVLKVGQQIIEANRMASPNAAFGVYLMIFLLYFIACWPLSLLADYLEKKWSYA